MICVLPLVSPTDLASANNGERDKTRSGLRESADAADSPTLIPDIDIKVSGIDVCVLANRRQTSAPRENERRAAREFLEFAKKTRGLASLVCTHWSKTSGYALCVHICGHKPIRLRRNLPRPHPTLNH